MLCHIVLGWDLTPKTFLDIKISLIFDIWIPHSDHYPLWHHFSRSSLQQNCEISNSITKTFVPFLKIPKNLEKNWNFFAFFSYRLIWLNQVMIYIKSLLFNHHLWEILCICSFFILFFQFLEHKQNIKL